MEGPEHLEVRCPGLRTMTHPCKLNLDLANMDYICISQVSNFMHITVGDHELAILGLRVVPGKSDSFLCCPAVHLVQAIDEIKSCKMFVLLNITMKEGNIRLPNMTELSMLSDILRIKIPHPVICAALLGEAFKVAHGRVCHSSVIFNTNMKSILKVTWTEVGGWISHTTAIVQAVGKNGMPIPSDLSRKRV
jgi:hypothetical protein